MAHKMYGLPRAPLEIATKARKAIWQDHICKTPSDKPVETPIAPRPTFQKRKLKSKTKEQDKQIAPQHQEIIGFISESWNALAGKVKVPTIDDMKEKTKSKKAKKRKNKSKPTIAYYVDPPCDNLKDFKPFDMDAWWADRLFMDVIKDV